MASDEINKKTCSYVVYGFTLSPLLLANEKGNYIAILKII